MTMSKSNYDRWEEQNREGIITSSGPIHGVPRYVAPARGAAKKWVNRYGRTVEVLRAEDEGLDGDGMPWLAVCTDHGNLVSVPTKASGISSCRDTTQFCGECQAEAEGRRKAEPTT
jgi:hypothetical protein